jgi:hypothetical protein
MSEQLITSMQGRYDVPPYRPGERIHVFPPGSGTGYLVRVERISPLADGGYKLVAAVRSPRRLRGHVVTITVDADGCRPELGLAPDRGRSPDHAG